VDVPTFAPALPSLTIASACASGVTVIGVPAAGVVIVASLLGCDAWVAASRARTTYRYCVEASTAASDVPHNDPADATGDGASCRYTSYAVTPTSSLEALQIRSTRPDDGALAVRSAGAVGGPPSTAGAPENSANLWKVELPFTAVKPPPT
jgi:hypothetical protein